MACKYKYKDKWYSEIEDKNQIVKDISLDDVVVELSTQMSYTVEINTTKSPLSEMDRKIGLDENDNINTSYYSNMTVSGGTNGCYRE